MKSEMPLVSVIVPVYMVEEYLSSCVDSIVNQTYKNLEIILVDDGSPDNCGKICDEYAQIDSRITVIHKENGGLSDARNAGIKTASGHYITCVDSDDYIAVDMVENLYNSIVKYDADISICCTKKTANRDEDLYKETAFDVKLMSPDQAIEEGLYNTSFPLSAWGKLYRRKLFEDIEYPVGKLYEDLFTTYKLFLKAKKIVYYSKVGYFYYYRSNSIVATSFREAHLDCFEGIKQMQNDGVFHNSELQRAYMSSMVEAYTELLEKKPPLFDKQIVDLWEQIKPYRLSVILNSKSSKRVRGKAFLLLLGRRLCQIMVNLYYKKKWKKNDNN